MICIYKITSPSNSTYIGQSRNIKHRFSAYKRLVCQDQPKLFNSLKKYGSNNHKYEIIHELPKDVTQEIVNTYEQLYIDLYRDCGVSMLNIKSGGSFGGHSEETKQKMKRRIVSAETREKIRASKIGKKREPLSEEWKNKLSEKLKGRNSNIGRIVTDATRIKQSLSRKGKKQPQSFIEFQRRRMKGNKIWLGKKHKEETKAKIGMKGSDNYMFGKKRGLCPSAKMVLNINTGIIYLCVQDAADAMGMKTKSLQKRLSGYWTNNTQLKYIDSKASIGGNT